jgi:hypothetical protein
MVAVLTPSRSSSSRFFGTALAAPSLVVDPASVALGVPRAAWHEKERN